MIVDFDFEVDAALVGLRLLEIGSERSDGIIFVLVRDVVADDAGCHASVSKCIGWEDKVGKVPVAMICFHRSKKQATLVEFRLSAVCLVSHFHIVVIYRLSICCRRLKMLRFPNTRSII